MTRLVSTPRQVLANIVRFEQEVEQSHDLQDRLAYARAWYADRDDSGKWRFGPSKFVGYEDLNARQYIDEASDRDGRRTEAQIQQWFTVVEPSSELYEEISAELMAFLARYGKAPSTKMRINVLTDLYREHMEHDQSDPSAAIVELILAVAKTLPASHLAALRARLAA